MRLQQVSDKEAKTSKKTEREEDFKRGESYMNKAEEEKQMKAMIQMCLFKSYNLRCLVFWERQ